MSSYFLREDTHLSFISEMQLNAAYEEGHTLTLRAWDAKTKDLD